MSFASTGTLTLRPVVTLAVSATVAGATPFTVTVTVAVLLPTAVRQGVGEGVRTHVACARRVDEAAIATIQGEHPVRGQCTRRDRGGGGALRVVRQHTRRGRYGERRAGGDAVAVIHGGGRRACHDDAALRARERVLHGIGGGDGLGTGGTQGDGEGAHTVGERGIGGQGGAQVAARDRHRAAVVGDDEIIGIPRGHGHGCRSAREHRRGEAGHGEGHGGGWTHLGHNGIVTAPIRRLEGAGGDGEVRAVGTARDIGIAAASTAMP